MNFGGWESENAKDKNAVDCYRHLHLYLKLDVVRIIESKYPGIHDKVNNPYQYGLLDCIELETYQLHNLEISEVKEIKDEIKKIKGKVKGIKEEVKGIKHTLDRILEHLKLQK